MPARLRQLPRLPSDRRTLPVSCWSGRLARLLPDRSDPAATTGSGPTLGLHYAILSKIVPRQTTSRLPSCREEQRRHHVPPEILRKLHRTFRHQVLMLFYPRSSQLRLSFPPVSEVLMSTNLAMRTVSPRSKTERRSSTAATLPFQNDDAGEPVKIFASRRRRSSS